MPSKTIEFTYKIYKPGNTSNQKENKQMDSIRAKEIIESHGVIAVNYHDSPVWIEQVKDKGQAEVTTLDTNQRMDVPLDQLVETDSIL
jgi:H-type small acid-soluble spore protein